MNRLYQQNDQTTDDYLKSIIAHYGHDSFFHYFMVRLDDVRLMFCQSMVKDRKLMKTVVQNADYYGHTAHSKRFVLDILATDELGCFYNIELQCYPVDKANLSRFQCYVFRKVDDEVRRGESYDIKPVKQMIINNSDPIEGLNEYRHHFTYYDEENRVELPHTVSEIYIVQTAYLYKEMEKKGELGDFDQFMYLFKNNRVYDKIKPSRMIEEVIEMHKEYMDSNEAQMALEREREIYLKNTQIKDAKNIGKKQGTADTLIDILREKLKGMSKECEIMIREADIQKLNQLKKNIFKVKDEEEVKEIVR